MAFYEVLFPPNISYGSSGGPGWLTRIVGTTSGFEYRSGAWSRTLGKWNAAHGLKTPADYRTLIAFFDAVGQGRLNGFRWLDYLDYKDDGAGTFQLNSAGGLQIAKTYTSPAPVTGSVRPTYVRFIDKPNTDLALPGGVTVDYTTGLVTGGTVGQTWTGTFHVPVRFDVDDLAMSMDQPWGSVDGAGATADVTPSWRNIPILELRLLAPS